MSSRYINGTSYANTGYTLSGKFQGITIGPKGTIGGTGIIGGTAESYTIVNRGRVTSSTVGVALKDGGSVTNVAGSLIVGQTGVSIAAHAGIVVNSGTIESDAGAKLAKTPAVAVYLGDGGSVSNLGAAADITGKSGIEIDDAAGHVTNGGKIIASGTAGLGVYLAHGGTVRNDAGATIDGYNGVRLAGGLAALVNLGTIAGTGSIDNDGVVTFSLAAIENAAKALITGNVGIDFAAAGGTIQNSGTIMGVGKYSAGIYMTKGGSVENAAGAIVHGYDGLDLLGAPGTVSNAGTISGSFVGVYLGSGGHVTNDAGGLIEAYYGVLMHEAGGTVTNSGTILGLGTNGVGVSVAVNGHVLNAAKGDIAARAPLGVGVYLATGGTVENAGTISGSDYAVLMQSASDMLKVDPGAVFVGKVGAGGGTLELAEAGGTLSGLGTSFVGFGTVEVLAAAAWTLTGTDALGGAGGGGERLLIAHGATLALAGSTLSVAKGGSGTIVNAGLIVKRSAGLEVVQPAIDNTGTIDAFGGTLTLAGAVTGAGLMQIAAKSTLKLNGAVAATESVSFVNGNAKTLIVADPSAFAGSIHALGGSDRLDLSTVAFSGKPKLAWSQDGNHGMLTVTDGSRVVHLTLFGQYTAAGFDTAKDSGTGTVVTYTAPAQMALAAPHR